MDEVIVVRATSTIYSSAWREIFAYTKWLPALSPAVSGESGSICDANHGRDRQPHRQHHRACRTERTISTRQGTHPIGIKVPEAELAAVQLVPAAFHGDWNYSITPTHIEHVIS